MLDTQKDILKQEMSTLDHFVETSQDIFESKFTSLCKNAAMGSTARKGGRSKWISLYHVKAIL